MCKPKSKGGARCNPHLCQGVNTSMVAFAIAETGQAPAVVKDAFTDLQAEGARLPQPTRVEVDEFLEGQAFRVRHNPTLTEHKRTSILGRLRAAIGKVMPSGGLFHAWKAIVAESWARSRRRIIAVFLGTSIVFGVGACGNAAAEHVPPAPTAAVATATATAPDTAPVTVDRTPVASYAPFAASGEAVDVFGQDAADIGYQEAAQFVGSTTFDDTLLTGSTDTLTADAFDDHLDRMTPSMADAYKTIVTKALTDDEKAVSTLEGYSYFGFGGDGVNFQATGPLVINHSLSNPRVTVDRSTGTPRLAVTVDQHGDVRMVQNGAPVLVPTDKAIALYLVPNPAGSQHAWQIDGVSTNWQVNEPTPDTGSY
jgi:hypothetical protein